MQAVKASAFVVGPRDGPGAALRDMATRLGFETVLPFAGVAQAEQQSAQTPLMFFLFAAVDDPRTLRAAADAIRFCPSRRVRFSPLVYFSESPSIAAIRLCAAMGFDDVLTLPFTGARVAGRIGRQIDRTQVYFETANYVGPDRRQAPGTIADPRRGASGQQRRIEIIRSFANGVSVLRDDLQAVA
jgi:hypothetical protein